MRNTLTLVRLSKLKPHEAIEQKRLKRLVERIKRDGCLKAPIVADQVSLVILDGHHRLQALKILGCKKIPVFLVNYRNDNVRVYLRRKELLMRLIKEAVIAKGERGELFPPKTTRHLLQFRPRNINIRLERLK